MWYLSLSRFLVGTVFLSIAAFLDIRTRKVPNKTWIFMGGIASVILFIDMFLKGLGWRFYLIFLPIAVLLVEALIERPELISDDGVNVPVMAWLLSPLVVIPYQIFSIGNRTAYWPFLSIVIMMALVFVLYYLRVLYGGADAKAVIVVALLVPFYPNISGLTFWAGGDLLLSMMEVAFPFVLILLMNAGILMLTMPVYMLLKNIAKGELSFPEMFFGYKKKVDDIEDSFVWPMEFYRNGSRKISLMPRGSGQEKLRSLKEKDRKEAWVSPKVPFMVPLLFGFVLSFIIGNPILQLIFRLYR